MQIGNNDNTITNVYFMRIAKFLQVNAEDIFTLEDDENPAV